MENECCERVKKNSGMFNLLQLISIGIRRINANSTDEVRSLSRDGIMRGEARKKREKYIDENNDKKKIVRVSRCRRCV